MIPCNIQKGQGWSGRAHEAVLVAEVAVRDVVGAVVHYDGVLVVELHACENRFGRISAPFPPAVAPQAALAAAIE